MLVVDAPEFTGELNGLPHFRTWQTPLGWRWSVYAPYQRKPERSAVVDHSTQKEAREVAESVMDRMFAPVEDDTDDA